MSTDTHDLFLVNHSAFLRLTFKYDLVDSGKESWIVKYRDYHLIPDEMHFFWEKEDDDLNITNGGKAYVRPHMRVRKELNQWIKRIYDRTKDSSLLQSRSPNIVNYLTSYNFFPGTVVDYQGQEWLVISSLGYCTEQRAVMLLPLSIQRPERPYYSLDIHSAEWIRRCLRYHYGKVPVFLNQTESKFVDVSKWKKVDVPTFLEHSKFKYIISSKNMEHLYYICDVLFMILLNLKWAA